MEVWDWGDVSLGKFSVVSLNISVNILSACVCRPGWFVSWSYNNLTDLMRSFDTLVAVSLGVSMGTQMCRGYSLYWSDTRIPPVVGTWNYRHL